MNKLELEAEIEREQARVDEMKRRREKKRPDGSVVRHGGYDDEIDESEAWLAGARARLATMAPRIVIFSKPGRTYPGEKFEDGSSIPTEFKGIEVVRNGQTVRLVRGRARVFDAYELLLGGGLAMAGTRREVMFQAHRLASLNEKGQIPLYLETSAPRWLVWDSIRYRQQQNRERRGPVGRRARKAAKLRRAAFNRAVQSAGESALMRVVAPDAVGRFEDLPDRTRAFVRDR